jgi:hypothetical protein
MTMCFPAYHNDPNRKRETLLRVQTTDWAAFTELPSWLPDRSDPDRRAGSPLHRLTGYPASLTFLAETILRHLPADRRGRFMAAFFDAPDVGADLAPLAEEYMAAAGQRRPPGMRPAAGGTLPVVAYPSRLEALLAQSQALGGGFDWMAAADLMIETLTSAQAAG